MIDLIGMEKDDYKTDFDNHIKLEKYIKLQKQFAEFYNKGLIAISVDSLQLNDDLFLELFDDYKTEIHNNQKHLSVIIEGVKIVAVAR